MTTPVSPTPLSFTPALYYWDTDGSRTITRNDLSLSGLSMGSLVPQTPAPDARLVPIANVAVGALGSQASPAPLFLDVDADGAHSPLDLSIRPFYGRPVGSSAAGQHYTATTYTLAFAQPILARVAAAPAFLPAYWVQDNSTLQPGDVRATSHTGSVGSNLAQQDREFTSADFNASRLVPMTGQLAVHPSLMPNVSVAPPTAHLEPQGLRLASSVTNAGGSAVSHLRVTFQIRGNIVGEVTLPMLGTQSTAQVSHVMNRYVAEGETLPISVSVAAAALAFDADARDNVATASFLYATAADLPAWLALILTGLGALGGAAAPATITRLVRVVRQARATEPDTPSQNRKWRCTRETGYELEALSVESAAVSLNEGSPESTTRVSAPGVEAVNEAIKKVRLLQPVDRARPHLAEAAKEFAAAVEAASQEQRPLEVVAMLGGSRAWITFTLQRKLGSFGWRNIRSWTVEATDWRRDVLARLEPSQVQAMGRRGLETLLEERLEAFLERARRPFALSPRVGSRLDA